MTNSVFPGSSQTGDRPTPKVAEGQSDSELLRKGVFVPNLVLMKVLKSKLFSFASLPTSWLSFGFWLGFTHWVFRRILLNIGVLSILPSSQATSLARKKSESGEMSWKSSTLLSGPGTRLKSSWSTRPNYLISWTCILHYHVSRQPYLWKGSDHESYRRAYWRWDLEKMTLQGYHQRTNWNPARLKDQVSLYPRNLYLFDWWQSKNRSYL